MNTYNLAKLIPLKLSHFSVIGLLYVLNIPGANSVNAPGTLATQPLHTSTSAQPNILFMLDDSGSMETIVAESPYDAAVTYDADPDDAAITACSSPLAAGQEVRLHLTGASYDTPQFTLGSGTTDFDLGNDTGEKCFNPTADYVANLFTGPTGVRTGVAGARPYSGNYLNWYFNPGTTTGTWIQKKPGTNTRIEVAQTSLSALINGVTNVRSGLALFDGSNGANFKVAMGDILTVKGDTSTTGTLLYEIDQASPGGSTPLAESLHGIGRYFTQGYCDAGVSTDLLTLHPGDVSGTETTTDCNTVFHNTGANQSTTAPVQFFCQKNFAIIMTDGDSKDDQNINDDSGLRDYDGDCTGTNATNCLTSTPNYDKKIAPAEYFSSGSDYLDDVAQAMFEMDLRPDLDDANGNEVTNNVTTYTIGFSAESVVNNTLLDDTATQAGGEFLQANNSSELSTAFTNAVNSIISQTSSSSSVTFNSSTLSSQSAVYQALFNTARWSGELNSYPIDGFTGDINTTCTAGSNNCWSAQNQLDAQAASSRFIITYADAKHGVEFKYVDGTDDYTNLSSSSDIPWALVADLCSTAVGTVSGTSFPCLTSDVATKTANSIYIEDLINYLRGDNSQEGSSSARKFRTRTTDLGDIVNSSPVYVGAPQLNWPSTGDFPSQDLTAANDNSYFAWKKSAIKDRTEVVYVASNDGMLHGFRTKESSSGAGDAGNEIFAYVPTGTFDPANTNGLHYLAHTAYNHRYYTDLTPTISDVYITHRTTPTDSDATTITPGVTAWRTVLLGGQGGGGNSLYLLDITDPAQFTSGNVDELVLWEFAENDLGYTYSKPTIAMMNNGKFAAIFGNGYNSNESGGDCKAKLFVVFLEAGLDGTWGEGTDYLKFDTGTANGGGAGDCNGLSTPAVVDLDGNGTADRVYAGDLKGNLWVFDLCAHNGSSCSATATDWGNADPSASPDPLMIADDGTNQQPITSKPIVSRDPASTGSDNVIIVFGTGQYLTTADILTTGTQTIYGVRDYGALTNTRATWKKDPRSAPYKFVVNSFTLDGTTGARVITTPEKTIAAGDTGWLLDLPDLGERLVVNPKIRNNILFFNTLIPDTTTCSYGGSGWLMSVNLKNGGSPPEAVFDLNNNGTIGDADDFISGDVPVGIKIGEIPAESTFLGDNQYTPGSDGTINKRKVNISETRKEGRMSWKEIYEAQ